MFTKNPLYLEELKIFSQIYVPWEKLKDAKILIAGATGIIGTFLVDLLMYRNKKFNDNITICAMGRNEGSAKKRFADYLACKNFSFISHDVSNPLTDKLKVDYIIHAASNAYPQVFSDDPVGTMKANFLGLSNLLEYSKSHQVKRVLYVSSGEVYGESVNNVESFSEDFCGYVDWMDPRACYPSSKRAAETLCSCYFKQYGQETVVVRPCHIYGPTITKSDNRVFAQFINNVISGQNIIMKSSGLQMRSYCYVADCVTAILTALLLGQSGWAYNIANKYSNITIREMAEIIANITNKRIICESPDEIEKNGYSKVKRAVLDATKLEQLGWKAQYDMKTGLDKTIQILLNSN